MSVETTVATLNSTMAFREGTQIQVASFVEGLVAIPSSTLARTKDRVLQVLHVIPHKALGIRKTDSAVRIRATGPAATTEQPVVPVKGQSEIVTGPGVQTSQIPHIVYFLEDEETLLKVASMLPLLLGTVKSPRVPVSLENQKVTVLLDTGAEVSVISKTLMQKLIGDGSRHVRLGQTKSVRPFANPDVQLEGPWGLTIEICGVRLIHPIYSLDADIPAVVGIDLLTAAKSVIDVMNRCVYSHHHARLEIEPALPNCEPVFRVDNATSFQSPPTSSSASRPASSGTSTVSQDLGGPFSFSGAGAPLASLHSADTLERPSPLAPVPLASPPTTGDSLHQDDVPMTCCEDQQPLQPPSPPFILSPYAPPFYPPASAPHYHPPVCDLTEPTTTPVQPPTTSSPPLPPGLFPPVTVTQPPPPPDPPDLPVPSLDPPDPPPLQDLQTPRSCPSFPLSPADCSDASVTQVESAATELPEHVDLLFLQTVENSQFPSQVR